MAMRCSRLLFFSSILIHLFTLTIAQQDYNSIPRCSTDEGNYTANSPYKATLDGLLSSLATTEFYKGFFNLTDGQDPDKVYVIALCRGDVQQDGCRSCLSDAVTLLQENCPTQKEAIAWRINCTLRYSSKSMFGIMESEPTQKLYNTNNVSDPNEFNTALETLVNNLRTTAAAGDSLLKFDTGDISANFTRIYSLLQCTPDLSKVQCEDCLGRAIAEIAGFGLGRPGARVLKPSCNLRYETGRFYEPTDDPTPPPALPPPVSPAPPTSETKNNTSRTIIIIVVPIVGVVVLIICIFIFLRMRRKRIRKEVENVDEIGSVKSLQFDFETIRAATDDFSEENKLGQGGFGAVYKGRLHNGEEIAVKRLSMNSGQGDLEFKNEVLLVAKLQHRNLVRLRGFCLEGDERLLIYEFVPNASLDHFLFDEIKRACLDWESRYKIIGGIARGLLYLHEDSRLRIIHRDLKVSNILLDEDMNPKIADFGMARLFVMDETQGNTSRIVGTYGYMAPEYAMHGQFSVKSDVYSFGVLVLEILSGQRNSCFRIGENVEDLLSCTWKSWRDGTYMNLVDPTLRNCSRTEMMRCIHIGLLCVQENVADRPNMASVALMLSSYSLTLPVPSQPAFFMHTTIESDMSSSVGYNSGMTQSNQSKTEIIPLSGKEASITELYPR